MNALNFFQQESKARGDLRGLRKGQVQNIVFGLYRELCEGRLASLKARVQSLIGTMQFAKETEQRPDARSVGQRLVALARQLKQDRAPDGRPDGIVEISFKLQRDSLQSALHNFNVQDRMFCGMRRVRIDNRDGRIASRSQEHTQSVLQNFETDSMCCSVESIDVSNTTALGFRPPIVDFTKGSASMAGAIDSSTVLGSAGHQTYKGGIHILLRRSSFERSSTYLHANFPMVSCDVLDASGETGIRTGLLEFAIAKIKIWRLSRASAMSS